MTIDAGLRLLATPSAQSVIAGGSTSYAITLNGASFAGVPDLSVTGLPSNSGATYGIDPINNQAVMLVGTTIDTLPGTTTLTISKIGSIGIFVVAPVSVTLTVNPRPPTPPRPTPRSGGGFTLPSL